MNESDRADFHEDFERAPAFATRLHATQVRTETDIPYISHLIAVAGLVLENGGDPSISRRNWAGLWRAWGRWRVDRLPRRVLLMGSMAGF